MHRMTHAEVTSAADLMEAKAEELPEMDLSTVFGREGFA